MSDYNRTTRECPVNELHPELLRAIQSYFLECQLGDLEAETLLCCETVSEKKPSNRLVSWLKDERDTTIYAGMLLTSQRLIWVRRGDQSGTLLNAANLKEIQVKAYTSLFTKDTGLEIFGYLGHSNSNVRGYIGMGTELAAQIFCEEVRKAIAAVQPTTQKLYPSGWEGRRLGRFASSNLWLDDHRENQYTGHLLWVISTIFKSVRCLEKEIVIKNVLKDKLSEPFLISGKHSGREMV
jgi:hypothetical protein